MMTTIEEKLTDLEHRLDQADFTLAHLAAASTETKKEFEAIRTDATMLSAQDHRMNARAEAVTHAQIDAIAKIAVAIGQAEIAAHLVETAMEIEQDYEVAEAAATMEWQEKIRSLLGIDFEEMQGHIDKLLEGDTDEEGTG